MKITKRIRLTIVICTFNRAEVLAITLKTVSQATSLFEGLEIVIVDNKSTDHTKSIINSYRNSDQRIHYCTEGRQGLSFARNAGAMISQGEIILYLDDDAKLNTTNITEIFETIESNEFSLFTGVWKAWHLKEPPKWLPYSTGNYQLKGPNRIREIGDDYITGLIMVINKAKLMEIGGFPTHLGMTGNKVAYGEETWVENEFKKRGWKVGINPNIVIDHLVGEHKYKLSWHLKAAMAKGFADKELNGAPSFLKRLFTFVKNLSKAKLRSTWYLVTRRDYYIQNFVIDTFAPLMYFIGSFKSK